MTLLHRIYRRTIGTTIRSNNRKTRVEKIMAILIESGVLYFLFFVSNASKAGSVHALSAMFSYRLS